MDNTELESSEIEEGFVTRTFRGREITLFTPTRALRLWSRLNRELEVFDFIDSMEEGDVLYDLGACEGRFSIYAALKGQEAVAFEPDPMNRQVLQKNKELNHLTDKNLHVVPVAVGRTNYDGVLGIGQPWAGGHHKMVRLEEKRTDLEKMVNIVEEISIKVVSLDDYVYQNKLPSPNFLKVDVDGSEWDFIQGAASTLASPKLRSMMLELFEDDAHYNKIMDSLAQSGLNETQRYEVEPGLFNILFKRV